MENELFEKTKVSKAYMTLALPVVLGMVVSLIYNMVDTFFIARTGNTALIAGVSLGTPIFTLMIALGDIFGVGGSSVISRLFGKKEYEDGRRISVFCFYAAIAVGIAVSIILLAAKQPILGLLGCDETTWQYAGDYYQWIALGAPFIILQLTPNNLLRTEGFAKASMIGTMLGAVVNIILDPILIFGLLGAPKMGVTGAAVATVIGQCVACIVAGLCNHKFNHEVRLSFRGFRPEPQIIGHIYAVGIPSIIMQSISSVMTYAMNLILVNFTVTATAVFGVYFKLQSFFFMPVFGLNNGITPIIAYNYGARKPQRITKTLKISCTAALCLMTVGLLVFQFFPDLLLGLFNPSQAFLEIGRVALRTISWSFPIAAICIALGASFQALGNGIYSTIVSLCRQLVVLLPVAYLLSLTGEVQRVWLAFPIAEVVSGTVTFICFTRIYRQKIKPLFEQA
mgnify:CR=1 FL=1